MRGTTLVVSLWILTLAGCAATHGGSRSSAMYPSGADAVPLDDPAAVAAALDAQHAEWRGTRYRLGGVDRDGVDCSAFTLLTFADRFGVALPRTTRGQAKFGVGVSPHALRVGDLVFFKTGLKTRHVGIYTGKGKFLHASTSKGVTQSSLNNPYWRKRFWQARRVAL